MRTNKEVTQMKRTASEAVGLCCASRVCVVCVCVCVLSSQAIDGNSRARGEQFFLCLVFLIKFLCFGIAFFESEGSVCGYRFT